MSNTVKITKSGLIKDLADGLTRKDIQKKYGLSIAGTRNLMKQANLASAKPASVAVDFVDDTVAEASLTMPPVVEGPAEWAEGPAQ